MLQRVNISLCRVQTLAFEATFNEHKQGYKHINRMFVHAPVIWIVLATARDDCRLRIFDKDQFLNVLELVCVEP